MHVVWFKQASRGGLTHIVGEVHSSTQFRCYASDDSGQKVSKSITRDPQQKQVQIKHVLNVMVNESKKIDGRWWEDKDHHHEPHQRPSG